MFLRFPGSFCNESVALRAHANGHGDPAIRCRNNSIQDCQALIVCKPVRFTHHSEHHDPSASSVGGAINQAFEWRKINLTVPIERGRQHEMDTIQASVSGQVVLHLVWRMVSTNTFIFNY
jgi:hypothetical protein